MFMKSDMSSMGQDQLRIVRDRDLYIFTISWRSDTTHWPHNNPNHGSFVPIKMITSSTIHRNYYAMFPFYPTLDMERAAGKWHSGVRGLMSAEENRSQPLQCEARCEGNTWHTNTKLTSETQQSCSNFMWVFVNLDLYSSTLFYFRPTVFKERKITSTFHTTIGKIIWKVPFEKHFIVKLENEIWLRLDPKLSVSQVKIKFENLRL